MRTKSSRTSRARLVASLPRRRLRRVPLRPVLETLEQIVLLSDVPETESNDSSALADIFVLTEYLPGSGLSSGRVLGSLASGADVDWFSFSAQAGHSVAISGIGLDGSSSVTTGGSALRFDLYNAANQVIASSAEAAAGRPQITGYSIGTAGVYYVRVDAATASNTIASYRVRLDLTATGNAETESNASVAEADPVTLTPGGSGAKGQVSGALITSTDVDTFALGELAVGSTLDISALVPSNGTLQPRVRLLRGHQGKLVAEAPAALIAPISASDTYFAQILPDPASSAGDMGQYLLRFDLTDAAAPGVVSDTLPTTLATNTSLRFDGTDNVAIPDSPSLRAIDGVTLEGWFNFDAVGGTQVLVAKTVGSSTRNSYALWHDGSSLRGIVGNASSNGTAIGFGWTPTIGRWYHLAFAFDEATDAQALYIDGVRVAANTNTTPLGYDTHPVLIGSDIDNEVVTHGFRGLADEVRIWNRGLSALEIDLGRLNPTPPTLAGMVGRWRLSEGTGTTVLDDSGLDNHGLIGGATTYAPSWTSGPTTPSLGSALQFDGVNDYVSAPHHSGYDAVEIAGELTIEAWIRIDGWHGNTYFPVVTKHEASNDRGWELIANRTAGLQFVNSSTNVTAAAPWNLGQWYHVAVTYDQSAGTVEFYRDGVSLGTRSHSSAIQDTAGEPIYIGASPLGGDEYSSGAVDEARVWSVVRTGAEIAAAKDAILTGSETGLVGYWRFEEGSGFTTADLSPSANTASLGAVDPRAAWVASGAPYASVGVETEVVRAIDRFSILLDEPPLASAAVNAANFRLTAAGDDGLFGTGDDGAYALTPSASGFASRSIAFLLDPQPLQPGRYRFSTTAGLTDRAGNAITPFEKTFTIVDPAAGVLENDINNSTIPGATALPLTEYPAGSNNFTSLGIGTHFIAGDVDYWRFDALAGDRVTIRHETPGGSGVHPSMSLRTSADVVLVSVGGNSAGEMEIVDHEFTAPGTYYLRIDGADLPIGYQVRVDLIRNGNLETETNDASTTADALRRFLPISGGYALRVAGTLAAADTGDWFQLGTLSAGSAISATAAIPAFGSLLSGDVVVGIYAVGSTTPIAESSTGSATYTVPADGSYLVRVHSNSRRGFRAQYFLNVEVVDSAPPTLTSATLPADGATSNALFDAFTLTFSEDMAPAPLNNPNLVSLISAGGDGLFGTTDDRAMTLATPNFSIGTTATYPITNGPLLPGVYRLSLAPLITDRAGNSVGASTRTFTIAPAAPYLTEVWPNDSLVGATTLSTAVENRYDGSYTNAAFTAGANNWDVIAADFDDDGFADAATADYGANTLS
ncbi:MAG: LamG-like jellyroll fold domain-containing protein, partial [Isosphaeraceae bacterium]|nr:LamG-like jellyroll fold domain-containing protein [Isosphaeraceae bacterium]